MMVSSPHPTRHSHGAVSLDHLGRNPLYVLLSVTPGYTMLVDTNILLFSLSLLAAVIKKVLWTIVIPVPVIMELDDLSSNTSQLSEAAQAAMAYVSLHTQTHSASLKVQTWKGNYLSSLAIRTEDIDFDDGKETWMT